MSLLIRRARPGEAGLVLSFVRELAEYEKLLDEMEATEADIDAALFGANPIAWHATNLLLHGLAAGLATAVLVRLLAPRREAGILAACVLVFHPGTSEVASWIMARGDSLSASLGLLAVLLALNAVERANLWLIAASAIAVLASLLAKETGAAWLVIVPACAWFGAPAPMRRALLLAMLLAMRLA